MLSDREREILSLACLSNRQIAKKLNISWTTVQRSFSTMFEKYGEKNRIMLLLKAIKDGEFADSGFEARMTDAEIIELIRAYLQAQQEIKRLYEIIERMRNGL